LEFDILPFRLPLLHLSCSSPPFHLHKFYSYNLPNSPRRRPPKNFIPIHIHLLVFCRQ
jgi:hypothetical protein